MASFMDLLAVIPKSVQVVIASGALGGIGYAAHEVRYMTVSDYMRGYLLELKSEIRQLKKDVERESIDPEVRDVLEDQLFALLDELCLELPDDPYCKDRAINE